jgi:hypothetical protein
VIELILIEVPEHVIKAFAAIEPGIEAAIWTFVACK